VRAWRSLTVAMWKAFVADKASLFFYFLFPLMFLVLFGLLFGDDDMGRTTVAVTGEGPLVEALPDEVLTVEEYADFDAAVEAVREGDVPAAIRVDGDTVTIRYSATQQVGAGTVQGVVQSVVGQANLAAAGVHDPTFTVRAEQVEDESYEAIQYLTSGLLSWAVAMSAAFGAALNLVLWRKNHVLRRLRLAPVGASSVVGARVGVSLAIALLQGVVFVGIATTPPFGLQLGSNWWLIVPLLMAGTLAFLSVGLLVGALVKTEEAASGAVNLIILPMAFLSGVFFEIDGLPALLQTISWVFPLRHLSDALLDVFVRDAGIADVLLPLGVLVGFAVVLSAVASRSFSWDDA
jgi:ABC-2 type transport system permease protein